MSVSELSSFDNRVFKAYMFSSAVLLAKMLLLSPLTNLQRYWTQVDANPDDYESRQQKVKYFNPDVKRIRIAHRKDLENILPFFMIGFFYVLTNPSAFLGVILFIAIMLSRIAHTYFYCFYVVPQAARTISYLIPLSINAFMVILVILHTM